MQTAGKPPSVRIMENRIAELEQRTAEAADFLDALAERCELPPTSITQIAFDCRAMATKLRGKA